MMHKMKDLLSDALQFLRAKRPLNEIRDMLIRNGLTENQAFLTYQGAKLIMEVQNEAIRNSRVS